WHVEAGVWWQYGFPISALGAALVLRRVSRGALAAFLIFAAGLFPVLGFLDVYPFRYSYVADHFQYLASVGLILPLASLLARAKPLRVAILAFAFLSWRQSADYRDSTTLYTATLQRNRESWLAHNNLGSILLERGQVADAAAHIQSALRIKPDYAEAHNNLGNARLQSPGRRAEAIAEYREAIRINPEYAEAHDNLGTALSQIPDRLQEAIAEYEAALRLHS